MSNLMKYEKLKDLISITHGYAFKSKNFETNFGGTNPIVLTPGNYAESSTLIFTEKNTKRVISEYHDKYLFKENDLTVVMTDLSSSMKILGKAAFINSNNILHNQRIGRIFFKSDCLLPRYLFYFFQTEGYLSSIKQSSTGTMVKHTAPIRILENQILLLSLPIQKQIVTTLDKAFTAIDQAQANIEKNIQNAQELFQSKLNQIFSHPSTDSGRGGEGWRERTLGEIGKVSMCKRILKKQTSPEGDIPFYKIGTFGKIPNAFIDKETYLSFKDKYSFPVKGDILISASGTIGRRVIYDGEPAYFQDSNIVWIDNDEEYVLNSYLYHFYGVCDWNPSKGATISRLYNADLRRIKISFPGVIEQKELVKSMVNLKEKSELIAEKNRKKFTNLEELKKSILQKAFAGELTGE